MKKILSILIVCVMVLGLAACGSEPAAPAPSAAPAAPAPAAPAPAENTAEEPVKIGIMQFGEFDALINASEGFKAGMAEAGFVEGQNVVYNYLSAAADTANCPTIADTLINDGSNLIFAIATPSVSCIKEKTTDIPVVFSAVTDPVASGLIADYNKPGANITGTSDMNPVKEQIDLLIQLLPDAKNVAVLYCSSESNSAAQYELAKAELDAKGLGCVQKTISAIDEAKSAIESLAGKVDAIYIPTDNTLADAMDLVSAAAIESKLPIVAGEPGQVSAGALATYGINYFELGKQSAKMAAEILNSADPLAAAAGMPVQYQTENLTTAVNTTTAKALGLEIPQAVLDIAEIYE